MTAPAREVTVAPGVLNAWGWLLARAPRLARAVHDTPGSAAVLAKVLNGIELIARNSGLEPEAFARRLRVEVIRDTGRRLVVVKVVR